VDVQMRFAVVAEFSHGTEPITYGDVGPHSNSNAARLQVAEPHIRLGTAQQYVFASGVVAINHGDLHVGQSV